MVKLNDYNLKEELSRKNPLTKSYKHITADLGVVHIFLRYPLGGGSRNGVFKWLIRLITEGKGGYDQASLNIYPNLFNIFIIQLLLFDKIC